MKNVFVVILSLIGVVFCNSCSAAAIAQRPAQIHVFADSDKIYPVPASLHVPSFYKKYIDADGVSIIGSDKVNDNAFFIARSIVRKMLIKIPEVKSALIKNMARILIVAHDEEMSDLPEYKGFDTLKSEEGIVLNKRVRGMGPTPENPYCSFGEENLLCLSPDRYVGQNLLVHEFAHAIAILGIDFVDSGFRTALRNAFNDAKANQLWQHTYTIANEDEYFATGVQCWFNAYRKSVPANGTYNEISVRKELQHYDKKLYYLLSKYFNEDDSIPVCK